MPEAELRAEMERLQRENEALRKGSDPGISLKVGE